MFFFFLWDASRSCRLPSHVASGKPCVFINQPFPSSLRSEYFSLHGDIYLRKLHLVAYPVRARGLIYRGGESEGRVQGPGIAPGRPALPPLTRDPCFFGSSEPKKGKS